MKRFGLLLVNFLVGVFFVAHVVQAHARAGGGDVYGNGGGWIEYELIYAWTNMLETLRPCVTGGCNLTPDERATALSISNRMIWKRVGLEFQSSIASGATFPLDDDQRPALIGFPRTRNDVFIVDMDRLYAKTATGIETPSYKELVRSLVRALSIDGNDPVAIASSLARKVAEATQASAVMLGLNAYNAPDIGVFTFQEKIFRIALSDSQGMWNLTPAVLRQATCRNSARPTELINLESLSLGGVTSLDQTSISLSYKGRLSFRCDNGESLVGDATITFKASVSNAPDFVQKRGVGPVSGIPGSLKLELANVAPLASLLLPPNPPTGLPPAVILN